MAGRGDQVLNERDRYLDSLLDELLELPAEKRADRLAEVALEVAERARLDRLLAAAEASAATPNPAAHLWRELLAEELPGLPTGERLGPYRVLREIGRGGMATVYLGERADGLYSQQVALKILDRSAADARAVARFERERQILATLEHPNIARLLDGGIAADARPWFALEYVEGRRIDEHCDELRLDLGARLALFVAVGRAVAAAHRQLVVHRDIKPSNVLVARDGTPKLLDFGIAKLLESDARETAGGDLTMAAVPMTPAYASPEQAAGMPVTTASDVFQLGLLLYELLTGERAFPLPGAAAGAGPADGAAGGSRGNGLADARTLPVEPPRPSAAFASGSSAARAACRGGRSARDLRRALSGDLDTILATALRREAGRRYESAARLVEDVEHYLAGRPITARPDSLAYRSRKFVARHRWAVAAVGAALAALVALSVAYAVDLRRERDVARREAEKAQQVSQFLGDLFEASDPFTAKKVASRTALELLDAGTRQVEAGGALGAQPEVRAALLALLADVYGRLGEADKALHCSEQALALRQSALGREHPDTLDSRLQRIRLLRGKSRLDEAAAEARALLPELERGLGPGDWRVAEAKTQLVHVILEQGDLAAAQRLIGEAIAIEEAQQPVDATRLARRLGVQASVSSQAGERELAVQQARRAIELQRTVDANNPMIPSRLSGMAGDLSNLGRVDEARQALIEADRILLATGGPQHPLTLRNAIRIGALSVLLGEPAAALERLDAALPGVEEALGAKSQWIGYGRMHRAMALVDLGRKEEALAEAIRAREATFTALGPTAPLSIDATRRLAGIQQDVGNLSAARDLLRETVVLAEAHLPAGSTVLPVALAELGLVELGLGALAPAEAAIVRALPLMEALWPEGHVDQVRALATRAEVAARRGQPELAQSTLQHALDLAARVEGVTPLLRERLDGLQATIGRKPAV